MSSKPKLDVHVCDHCNPRCSGCLHFAPLAEKAFLDLRSFTSCSFGGCCLQLAREALWPCQVAAHHGHFARRFGYPTHDGPKDSLALDSTFSTDQIDAFRRRSHPMCRCCNNDALTVAPWERSALVARE